MALLFMEDHWLLYTVSLEVFADDTDYETTDMRTVSGGAIMCGGACVWSVSTIGGGGDTTIPSPGRSPKQKTTPSRDIGLPYPLHGRRACPEFNSFHQGVGQISPQEGYFCAVPSLNGDIFVTSPLPPQSLNDSLLVF